MKIFWILLLFIAAVYASDTDDSKRLEHVSLQLHWKYEFEFAGFIAAKEKGFYKDAGLDVELKEYKNGVNIIDDVISGKSTYGIYNSSTLIEYLKGKPVVLVASFFKRSALVLITKPDIKSPKDLVGKRVMCTSKEDMKLNFGPYFKGYGVKLNTFQYVPQTFRVKEFAEGKVDAMTAYISDQPYKLDELGIKYNVLDPSSENLFTLQEELFTSKEEAQTHPKRVEAFRDASIRGWEYALAHKKEIIDIIHKKYAPKISKASLAYEANAIEKLILPYIYDIGSIDVNFLHKQMILFQKSYNIGKGKELSDFIFRPRSSELELSDEEKAYIRNNPILPMCIHYEFMPIEGIENDDYTGMMADFYRIVSKKTGFEFKPVPSTSDLNLEENFAQKKCKLISITATHSNRFVGMHTTMPISRTFFTLLTKLNHSFIYSASDLKDKLLVVQREWYRDYLNHFYPYLNIEVEPNQKRMLEKVLQNRAYAIVTIDEKADYFINDYGYGKLKINGFLLKEHPLEASVGIQKDEPVLFSIMQKTLKTMSPEQIESIISRWRLTRYHKTTDYTLVIAIFMGMGIILLIMIHYQKKLKRFNKELERNVAKKTKELREINDSLEITVQEKINELLQKDEILTRQSKQAVMGEMISMIAHQWRQPLNTIALKISNIQLQEMMSQSVTKEQLLEVLKEINNTIQYLSGTIDDFKTYFKPNKNATKTTLKNLIDKSLSFIDARVKKENIRIYESKLEDVELTTYSSELIQVILNIVNNAIDAYIEHPWIEDKVIKIYSEIDQKWVRIFIYDRAGGISNDVMKQLFEPYFSTKEKNGTGLGLYMSKMIIEKQFDGTIDVHSRNATTTFIIEIPKNIKEK